MPDVAEIFDGALQDATRARTMVSRIKTNQVRGVDPKASLKATALTWFNTHKRGLLDQGVDLDFSEIDSAYSTVLEATSKLAAKRTYLDALRQAKQILVRLRTQALTTEIAVMTPPTDDVPPDFSPLAGNEEIRGILTRRWSECCKCVNAQAHLAAIVMMGGLLEALFVARANKLSDKTPLLNATAAPKEKATGKTMNYQEWMLDSYIKVGLELGWITGSARNVADVLKEYRNYVHPEKERRHGVVLDLNDSEMFWSVTKSLVRQLLLSATRNR